MKVYPRHIQEAGFCLVPGAKNWAKAHNIDWRDFVKNGVDVEVLRAHDDVFTRAVIAKAEAENHG